MGQTLRVMRALWNEGWPPASKFSVADIPDLTSKVVIVTGGYSGIGREVVLALLQKNAKVYIAARSRAKAEVAIGELKELTGREALFFELDLADLKSVKRAVEEFQNKESQLHILFNNGGVFLPPVEQLTAHGHDLQFGTNVLGHFYFTQLLLPTLIETARTVPERHVRVITTASFTHWFHRDPGFMWDTLKGHSAARTKYGSELLYAQSKYGNLITALELARRYGDQGIVSIPINPGNIKTEMQRHMSPFQRWTTNLILYPAPLGGLTQLWAGTMPETAAYNGKYLIPWARVGEPRKEAKDPETAVKLWEWLEAQVKEVMGEGE
ncbi:hypothetical protein M0805_000005 [Coniferiporia weirii]|nr:hypothetical protein M0805_000005 [Coniferiporia weirii]